MVLGFGASQVLAPDLLCPTSPGIVSSCSEPPEALEPLIAQHAIGLLSLNL